MQCSVLNFQTKNVHYKLPVLPENITCTVHKSMGKIHVNTNELNVPALSYVTRTSTCMHKACENTFTHSVYTSTDILMWEKNQSKNKLYSKSTCTLGLHTYVHVGVQ